MWTLFLDGDTLVLTKPLGTGAATTAMKRGSCPPGLRMAVDAMTTLNDCAARVAVEAGVRCATDVTGFGLVGHLTEVVRASGVGATVFPSELPVFDGVVDLITSEVVPGGTRRNVDAASAVDWGSTPPELRVLACDAQTSGGLLLAVPRSGLDYLLREGAARGVPMNVIGHLDDVPDRSGLIAMV